MVPEEIMAILRVFLFPGFFFLFCLAFFTEWLDRKLVAKFQSRYGPLQAGPKGILQPIADFIKLLSKEDITPAMADRAPFAATPILMLALAMTPLFCVPMSSIPALVFFEGDLIVVMFIMSLTALLIFVGAWVSTNRFSMIGGIRAGLQMFGYEIPLILSFCLLAHLQKIPFDIPEAESEIVSGWLVEFSGKKLALLRLASDFEMVLAASLMVSLYLGGPSGLWQPNILVYFIKLILCVFILSNLRALFARYRIDQLLAGTWKYLTPLALLQISIIKILTW